MVSITFHLYQKLHLYKNFHPMACKQIHPFMQMNPSLIVQIYPSLYSIGWISTSNSILHLLRIGIKNAHQLPSTWVVLNYPTGMDFHCFAESTMGCHWSRSNCNQLLHDYLLTSGSLVMMSRHVRLAAITCNVKSVHISIHMHLGFGCVSK